MTFELSNALCTCIQILAPMLLFASSLPLREPRGPSALAAGMLFLAWTVLLGVLVPLAIEVNEMLLTPVVFACTLLLSWGIVLLAFQTSPWAALFCATAGYTLQNLASGLGSVPGMLVPAFMEWAYSEYFNIVAPYLVVYAAGYALLIRRVRREGLDLIEPQAMLAMMVVVILAVISYDVVVKQLYNTSLATWLQLAVRLSHITLCVLVLVLEYELLYGRRLRQEVAAMSQVMATERAQYQMSRETIAAINVKCHDIRRQIHQLGAGAGAIDPELLAEMERTVNVYDATVHTDLEPLDVILTEKSLICQREGITLTVMADGECLAFMAPADLYALMGNALDNAIEAARAVADPARRSVSVLIRRSGGMASIHVENYFSGEVHFRDGLPLAGSEDGRGHGYGTRSMQLVARRYEGTLHLRCEGDVFHLNAALPIPEDTQRDRLGPDTN